MEHTEYKPKNIFSGNVMPVVIDKITLVPKQDINELSIIFYDETKKEFFTEGETIDSSKVYALSSVDAKTSEFTTEIPVYLTGEFNKSAVVLPKGKAIDEYITSLRKLGIFLK